MNHLANNYIYAGAPTYPYIPEYIDDQITQPSNIHRYQTPPIPTTQVKNTQAYRSFQQTQIQSEQQVPQQIVIPNTQNKSSPIYDNNQKTQQVSVFGDCIKDVWSDNFEEEMINIMKLVDKYHVIAMDTEFPGIVQKTINTHNSREFEYQLIKKNVDQLKIIQLGISFSDENGNIPPGIRTWQFNFEFDIKQDTYLEDSIKMLKDSGLDFDRHKKEGINPLHFAEWFTISGIFTYIFRWHIWIGIPFNEEIKWIIFHGGYDFAYLVKVLTHQELPETEKQFYEVLKIFFPNFYDIKYLIKDLDQLKSGGLNRLANELDIRRIGLQHQAGSDSLLTLMSFFKIKDTYCKGFIDAKYENIICGLDGESESYSDPGNLFYMQEYQPMLYQGYGLHNLTNRFYPGIPDTYMNGVDYNLMFSGYNMNYPSEQINTIKSKKYYNAAGMNYVDAYDNQMNYYDNKKSKNKE